MVAVWGPSSKIVVPEEEQVSRTMGSAVWILPLQSEIKVCEFCLPNYRRDEMGYMQFLKESKTSGLEDKKK